MSPMDEPFELVEACIGEVFPDAVATPYVMMAATDSRHFTALSDHVYRFSPVRARPEDLSRFHGTNERIATANLAEVVRFYLEDVDLQVDVVENGQKAMTAAMTGQYQLILMDVRMPDMTGLELVARLKELGVPLSVLLMPGFRRSVL